MCFVESHTHISKRNISKEHFSNLLERCIGCSLQETISTIYELENVNCSKSNYK